MFLFLSFLFILLVCFFMPKLHILAWKLQFWQEIFNLTYWVTSILGSLHTHKNPILAYTEWPFFQRNFTRNASPHFVLRQARLRHFHNWESPHPLTHWQKHTTYTRLCLRPRGGYFHRNAIRGCAAQMGRFLTKNPLTWVPFLTPKSLNMGPFFKNFLKIF